MTARSIVVALALAIIVATTANAQIPYIKVYSDPAMQDYYLHCGAPGTVAELFVVLHNANMVVSAVDFSINYPYIMSWIYDQLPYAWMVNNEVVTIGSSPLGIAIAWGAPWMQDGAQGPILLLRPVVIWHPTCDCGDPSPNVIDVNGYGPLGKTQPSFVRYPDFEEFTALGMASFFCGDQLPVESATWSRIKALYRD